MFNQGLHLCILGVGEKSRPSLFHLFLSGVVRVLNTETAVLEERGGAAGVLGARAKEAAPSRFRTLQMGRKLVRLFPEFNYLTFVDGFRECLPWNDPEWLLLADISFAENQELNY